MATWDPAAPALADDIASDLGKIRDNFAIIGTAWSGDHVALATDGTDSTSHTKVSLKAQTAAAAVANFGVIYCDSANSNDLYYAYPTGGAFSTARLTQSGVTPGGAYAFCTVPDLSSIKLLNSKNVTSVVDNYAGSHYNQITINFTTLSIGTITAVSIANPSQITTAANHGLVNGDTILISGVTGDGTTKSELNNKEFVITKVDDTNFTIGAAVTGTWSGGGNICKAYTFLANCDNTSGYCFLTNTVSKYVDKIELTFDKYTTALARVDTARLRNLNFVMFVK